MDTTTTTTTTTTNSLNINYHYETLPCEICNEQVPLENFTIHQLVCAINNGLINLHNRTELVEPLLPNEDELKMVQHASQARSLSQRFPKYPVLEKTACPICLCSIKKECRELSCGHTYCPECIDKWWQNQLNCPMCRLDLSR